jgi:hypothetical protein
VLREEEAEEDIGGLMEGPPVRPRSRVQRGSVDSTLSLPDPPLGVKLLGVEIGVLWEGVGVIVGGFGVEIRSLTESPA